MRLSLLARRSCSGPFRRDKKTDRRGPLPVAKVPGRADISAGLNLISCQKPPRLYYGDNFGYKYQNPMHVIFPSA
jgi:hypothetical protein